MMLQRLVITQILWRNAMCCFRTEENHRQRGLWQRSPWRYKSFHGHQWTGDFSSNLFKNCGSIDLIGADFHPSICFRILCLAMVPGDFRPPNGLDFIVSQLLWIYMLRYWGKHLGITKVFLSGKQGRRGREMSCDSNSFDVNVEKVMCHLQQP